MRRIIRTSLELLLRTAGSFPYPKHEAGGSFVQNTLKFV